jgi:hypothetical protein
MTRRVWRDGFLLGRVLGETANSVVPAALLRAGRNNPLDRFWPKMSANCQEMKGPTRDWLAEPAGP